ncbi:NAD-dependent deacylase [Capnocytophaga sp. ARDL2]|uniref:SIR2 family NAD-dependent protein deacylase n=1 Tax=Capnocytophaga sp. ARDL2 TaxID=3238809 RepID=UPI00355894BF
MKQKLVVLSGAGISAESGISTFRDANGLWENHRIEEVASPEGFEANPELVMRFYNLRRAQLKEVVPNEAHKLLVQLEEKYDVQIITQNVDDLHERAGSSNVLHLHGELNKVCPIDNTVFGTTWEGDLHIGDTDERGVQLRPYIVWFGEAVPNIELATFWVENADILLVIGTSLQVYPAAGLLHYAPKNCKIYHINPDETPLVNSKHIFIQNVASKGMKTFCEMIENKK